jgi:peptidoglycan/LPS O-acetylase OafA/YrhL
MSKTSYLPGLTPLRGLAALLVVIFHYNSQLAEVISPVFTPIIEKMYLMVDLFFVLSGFVMYHVYGHYFRERLTPRRFAHFMWARFARIYPLHLATLALMVFIAAPSFLTNTVEGFFAVVYDVTALPSHIAMTQAMGTHHEATWNTPSWSISVEWWTYLMFPLIVVLFKRTSTWSRWLAALLVLGGYVSIMYYFQPNFWAARWEQFNVPSSIPYPMHIIDVITGPAMLRCVCGFVWGMLVYELYEKRLLQKLLAYRFSFSIIWFVLLTAWHFNVLPDYGAVLLFGGIILATAYSPSASGCLLNNRVFKHIGDISFSLYLIHMPLIFAFAGARRILVSPDPFKKMLGFDFPPVIAWIGLIILLLLSAALATLSYRFVEQPCRKFLNGLYSEKTEMRQRANA